MDSLDFRPDPANTGAQLMLPLFLRRATVLLIRTTVLRLLISNVRAIASITEMLKLIGTYRETYIVP